MQCRAFQTTPFLLQVRGRSRQRADAVAHANIHLGRFARPGRTPGPSSTAGCAGGQAGLGSFQVRRGAGNAIANCGVAAIAAIAAATTMNHADALLALAAALTAGGSDTVASEIGKAWGRSPFLVTTFSRVKPGTPGAMSLEGTAAGLAAAFALATAGVAMGLIPAAVTLAVVAGATAGALVESALSATLEGPGILNNDVLNFINTATAAVVTLAIA